MTTLQIWGYSMHLLLSGFMAYRIYKGKVLIEGTPKWVKTIMVIVCAPVIFAFGDTTIRTID